MEESTSDTTDKKEAMTTSARENVHPKNYRHKTSKNSGTLWKGRLCGTSVMASLGCQLATSGINEKSSDLGMSGLKSLRWGDAPWTWATPYIGSLYEDTEEGRFCSVPACSPLADKCLLSLALEPASLGFGCILMTDWNMQSHAGLLEFSWVDSCCWTVWITACNHSSNAIYIHPISLFL